MALREQTEARLVGFDQLGASQMCIRDRGKTAARRTISSGGASINNVKVEDPEAVLREEDVLAGGLALIRKGRKNLAVLELS